MRTLVFVLIAIIFLESCNYSLKVDQGEDKIPAESAHLRVQDKIIDADEYGMKKYVMAFLKRGPSIDQDSVTKSNIQRAHLDNINRMADSGQLVLAGPFLDDGEIRGIYIFNVETIKEAKELTASDPAVKTGRLIMELHPWYGSAALLSINELHEQISKKDI